MAVPKNKTSKSKRGLRRGGNGYYLAKLPNVGVDKTTGEYKLSHHVSIDGYYNEKMIISPKEEKDDGGEE